MSEPPKRIWAGKYHETWWQSKPHHQMTEYIRADLVEAAIKRALEGAATRAYEDAGRFDTPDRIRTLDPAQFIEEEAK